MFARFSAKGHHFDEKMPMKVAECRFLIEF